MRDDPDIRLVLETEERERGWRDSPKLTSIWDKSHLGYSHTIASISYVLGKVDSQKEVMGKVAQRKWARLVITSVTAAIERELPRNTETPASRLLLLETMNLL